MDPIRPRLAFTVAALYFGYEAISVSLLWVLRTVAAGDSAQLVIALITAVVTPLPYAVAAVVVFWVWPPSDARRWRSAVVRSVVATAGGVLITQLVGMVAAVQVSGRLFTSVARQYTFPDSFFSQLPAASFDGFVGSLPVLIVAGLFGVALVMRRRPAEFDPQEAIE